MDVGEQADVVIVGAGAAGLMAGIWAARSAPGCRVVLLDGARTLGAKILVSGGGRCNVTHDTVDATAYAGSTRPAIAGVLRRFAVPQTVAFFRELGVELKREETGKLFPTSDSAKTVLHALLAGATQAGATVRHPCRVETVESTDDGFRVAGPWGTLTAQAVILATGGRSLPKSGSDGQGFAIAQALGHTLTPQVFPALVPLLLPADHPLCTLSGIAVPATLDLWTGGGKRLQQFTNSTLCTHFGLSGPAPLDMSRYWTAAHRADPATTLTANWLPGHAPDAVDATLQGLGRTTVLTWLRAQLPDRLARTLGELAEIDPLLPAHALTRPQRQALVRTLTRLPLPISGDRGYNYAEVTAGGVPLAEIHLPTMESRRCPNLYLCGELCDVDGQIGGYNYQWAWASGYVAGTAVMRNAECGVRNGDES